MQNTSGRTFGLARSFARRRVAGERAEAPPMADLVEAHGRSGRRFAGLVAWPRLFETSMRQAHAAVAQPGVMQLTADLAIHSWDLARATDEDTSLDPGVVALLLPWVEASIDQWAAMGLFAPRIESGSDAGEDIHLLGLMGRKA